MILKRKQNFHLENRILNKFLNRKQNFQMKKFSNKTFVAENFNVFILDLHIVVLTSWSSELASADIESFDFVKQNFIYQL